ncbi:hypothetical protein C1893_02315 [Pseudomonas sp. MPR-ANC1]|uniref:hypothetical protein n=1 Tax=Pseudomonas sp. MPR-ANC1 TaxID=2075548 RepID=UPI000CD0A551|nr:hypothetical protein [Pseudomonas sp. MPR-ANC1]POA50400.1 hypothetical protein C1893_02315 [Pseudomonas sp. MPR-ANC1]
MNTSRYAKGSGRPPVHLASINTEGSAAGHLVFAGGVAGDRHVPFCSHDELLGMLKDLICARVPFSVGGMCPGPADEVGLLIDNAELTGPCIELSWTGSQQWIVRETANASGEWQQEPDASEIANLIFNPDSLKRAD